MKLGAGKRMIGKLPDEQVETRPVQGLPEWGL
jgi:hypothetical protein